MIVNKGFPHSRKSAMHNSFSALDDDWTPVKVSNRKTVASPEKRPSKKQQLISCTCTLEELRELWDLEADTFPYKIRYFNVELKTLFDNLQNSERVFANVRRKDGQLLKISIVQSSSMYFDVCVLTDLFTEDARARVRTRYEMSPYQYWNTQKRELDAATLQRYRKLTPETIRETLFRSVSEASNFNIIAGRIVYEHFLGGTRGRVFDPFGGYGDRAIAAASTACVTQYVGYDNNPALISGYKRIEEVFNTEDIPKLVLNTCDFHLHQSVEDFDLCLTSPPFFTHELYREADEEKDIGEYQDWLRGTIGDAASVIYRALRSGSHAIIYVGNTACAPKLIADVGQTFTEQGFRRLTDIVYGDGQTVFLVFLKE